MRRIADGTRLRPGLTVRRALDLYVTWTLPVVYRTLVPERSWSLNRYENWLAELLIREFLDERRR